MENKILVLPQHHFKYKSQLTKLTIYVIFICGSLVMITPLIWALITSLKSLEEILINPMNLIPQKWAWANYLEVFKAIPLQIYFLNSIKVTLITLLGTLITCSMAAYAFARLKFPGRDYLFLIYLATFMIPNQLTLVPSFILMRWFGLIDNHLSLILLQVFSSFNAYGIFLLRQFFLGIPRELEEAAMLDGCSFFMIFTKVILPLSKPGLATLSIFALFNSWNDYLYPLIFINNEKLRTLPLGLAILRGDLDIQWNLLMSAALLSILPIIVLFLFAQKFFVESVTFSGIKG